MADNSAVTQVKGLLAQLGLNPNDQQYAWFLGELQQHPDQVQSVINDLTNGLPAHQVDINLNYNITGGNAAPSSVPSSDPFRAIKDQVFRYYREEGASDPEKDSEQQIADLKAYFASDPNIKGNQQLQQQILSRLNPRGAGGDSLAAQARGINWNMLTPEQKSQNPQPKDASLKSFLSNLNAYSNPKGSNVHVDTSQLQKYLRSLDSTTQYAVLQTVQSEMGTNWINSQSKVTDLLLTAHKAAAQSLQRQGKPVPQEDQQYLAPAQQQAQPTQSQQSIENTPAVQQVTNGYDASKEQTGTNTAVSPNMLAFLAEIYGITPDQMAQQIQTMAQSQQVQVSYLATPGQALTWSKGTVGETGTTQGGTALGTGWAISGLTIPQTGPGHPGSNFSQISYALAHGADAAKFIAGIAVLQYKAANPGADPDILNNLRTAVEARAQQSMQSPSERPEILSTLQSIKMDPATLGSVINSGAAPTVNTGNIGWLAPLEAQFKTQNPTSADTLSQIQTYTGSQFQVDPTQLAAMRGWSTTQIQEWAQAQKDPQHPGFTYAAWQNGYNSLLSQWQQNFGGQSTPPEGQMATLMGMTQQQQQNWFDSAPVPGMNGMTSGTFKGYSTLMNSVRDDLPPDLQASFIQDFTNKK